MLLDRMSHFISQVRGLPILLAVVLVVLNFFMQFVQVPFVVALAETDLLLHLAVVVGLMGVLLADAIGAW